MGKGSCMRGFRRNMYSHPIHAKVGTHPLTVIFVTLRTATRRHSLQPGERLTWRARNSVNSPTVTGIVAPETVPGGTLFITLI